MVDSGTLIQPTFDMPQCPWCGNDEAVEWYGDDEELICLDCNQVFPYEDGRDDGY